MKTTLNLIKQFVKVDAEIDEIAEKLTKCGFEVEDVIRQDRFLNHVVVGKILKIEKHPNADTLNVCAVDIGDRKVQIITSAKNIAEGDLVPVSLEGANLANNIAIKKSNLRGVDSDGMFCSGEELGFGDEFYEGASVNGILIFKDDFKAGTPVAEALSLTDIIMDVNITANRPDAASGLGLAKELAAIYNTKIVMPKIKGEFTSNNSATKLLSVDVQNNELCPIYTAGVVSNVKIKKSPLWLRSILLAMDIKPINNIVDITNFMLISYGQPMHAFDYDKIKDKKIIVRNAANGEKLKALNNSTIALDESMLVIASVAEPMVIAGVIGGIDSGISSETKTIVFESAMFNRKSVRITARKIGVRTDSSARFERGVDAYASEAALKYALDFAADLGVGDVDKNIIVNSSLKDTTKTIELSIKKIERILGIDVPKDRLSQILESLELKNKIVDDKLTIIVPPVRSDIENEADVAEEFIRLYGYDVYDNMDSELFKSAKLTVGGFEPIMALGLELKTELVGKGYFEALNYSLVNTNALDKLNLTLNNPLRLMIKVANPLSSDLEGVRTSMSAGLFNNVLLNYSRGNKDFKLMETGRVYLPKALPLTELPLEQDMLAFVSDKKTDDFFTFKGIVENILSKFSEKCEFVLGGADFLHPNVSAKIVLLKDKSVIGCFGKVHPKVLKNFEIGTDNLFYGELNISKLALLNRKKFASTAIAKYQQVERDLALVVKEEVLAKDIINVAKKAGGELVNSVDIFDIYRGTGIENGFKSIAIKIKASSLDHTLKDDEINNITKNILSGLEKQLSCKLR